MSVRRKFSDMLLHNWGLKLVSLLFAVLLWNSVLASTNPLREKTVNDVPVTFINEEALKERNLIIVNKDAALQPITALIEAERSRLQFITRDSIHAELDVSYIQSVGEYPVNVSVPLNQSDGNAKSTSPDQVMVKVDRLVSVNMPIQIETTGQLMPGHIADAPQCWPDTITIEGALVHVQQVQRAVVTVPVDGVEQTFSNDHMAVKLYDADGNEVDFSLFTVAAPLVNVSMTVEPTKTVPIEWEQYIQGLDEIEPGFELKSVEIDPQEITLRGPEEALAGVTSIAIERMDVAGISSNQVLPVTLNLDQLPEDVRLVQQMPVSLVVSVTEMQQERVFETVPVRVTGLPDENLVTIEPTEISVTVNGRITAVSDLDVDQIELTADASTIPTGPGMHDLPISYVLPASLADATVTLSAQTVRITIEE